MAKKKQDTEPEAPAPSRRHRRGTDQLIADLEAKIATIKAREARKQAKKDPSIRHTSAALRSIDKALSASKDVATKQALNEARSILSACLALNGVTPSEARVSAIGRGRRSSGDIETQSEVLLTYVRNNPGQRGEQIAAALSTDTASMRPVMKRLIGEGKIKTKGERRGMTYSAV